MSTEFSSQQYEAIYPDGIEYHYWTRARNRIIARALEKQGVKGEILEVGCGKGIVVAYLNQHRFNCSGVELAPVQVLPAMQDKILTETDANDLPPSYCDRFTAILLLDVIEHIANPASFLMKLKSRFKNLQTVMITVPARQELFSNYDEFNGHYRRYDLSMMSNLATETGLTLSYQSYLFHTLYYPTRLLLWLFGKRKVHITAPSGIKKYLHAALSLCMYIDALLLPKKLKGTSIIAVMKV